MKQITPEEKAALKGRGMISAKDGEHFTARILTENGTVTSDELRALAEAGDRFAGGTIFFSNLRKNHRLATAADSGNNLDEITFKKWSDLLYIVGANNHKQPS